MSRKERIGKSRIWLLITIIFMAFGTVTELFLIGHYEDNWQIVPIILIAATLVNALIVSATDKSVFKISFKTLLVACLVSGVIGSYFHMQANMEFESEMHPTQPYFATFTESLSGALPILAPGSMIVFALIGYIYSLQILNEQK